jgi:hypothetical protein
MKIDQITNEGMMDNPGQEDSPVAQAIIRRILLQRTDLLAKHGPERVGAAVDEVADFVGDVDEIGSSDVSGWVRHVEQMLGNMEQGLNEFAPDSGSGESGRWYTDDQMTDIVGDGWWQDLDISGAISKQAMIQEAQAWLDDQGYSVQVLNVKVNDDDTDWFIQGSFDNPGFANEGVAEGNYDRDDYYNARQGREYGKDLTATGYGGDGSGTRRDDIFKGQSKNLPADPFRRTSGSVPHAAQGQQHRIALPGEVDEGEKVGNMDADAFDAAMARLKKLAGSGPMKTVYDPAKRVYRNVPTAVQPKK